MFFRKPKVIFWPREGSLDIYFDQKENNTLKLDIDLFSSPDAAQIQSLNTYLSQNKIDDCQILVPDDVIFTKSFLYDSKITQVEKNEVIGLAESFVHFKINPDSIDYNLVQTDDKTIIQSRIYDYAKINLLKNNLSQTKLKNYSLIPVSAAISKVMLSQEKDEYFLLFPLNSQESTLILSKGDSVYLTANFKNSALDIQKIINYSNLYFTNQASKLYLPADTDLDITTTSNIHRVLYHQPDIAVLFNRASNLPLPVLGCIINPSTTNSVKPKPNMETLTTNPAPKKNLLPLVAVFVVTAAIASIVVWYVLNNNSNSLENPSGVQPTATETVETPTPTVEPTPSPVAEISKSIKIQVLNATDINGQAATMKERLIKLGFTSVTVGNATETVTANTIKVTAASSTASAYFQQKLVGFYDNATVETLPTNSTYDVVFVIGEKLGTAALITDAPTPKASSTASPSATPTEE